MKDCIADHWILFDELDKIKAMLVFLANTTDLLLTSAMEEKQLPMNDTPYGMHLIFMETIGKLEKTLKKLEGA
ncbi:MAG: hypothetical protein HQK89_17940 [Nitrospirae bacterium]|nr:hypothetical protein [Nitrospirota bacterium]